MEKMQNVKKTLFGFTLFFLASLGMSAQKTVKLWHENMPFDNGLKGDEVVERDGGWITNISVPEIHIYQPDKAKNSGMAVLICPGGGYGGVAFSHEGIEYAQWLNTLGITGVILKYRMPNKNKEIPLADAQQAMRYMRDNAKELGIDVNKVGVSGFSAGGHLAATVSTHYAVIGTNTRPDFSILFYPVITMEIATHGGSRTNLLGDSPSSADIYRFSAEKQVNANTPPTIILVSDDDKSVLPLNSTLYYDALKRNDIPTTLYIFPEGDHGWGMRKNFTYHTQMQNLLEMWLKDMQMSEK